MMIKQQESQSSPITSSKEMNAKQQQHPTEVCKKTDHWVLGCRRCEQEEGVVFDNKEYN